LARWCCGAYTVIGNSRLDLRVPLLCNRGPPSTGCTPSCVSNYSPSPISHHGPFRRQHLEASRTGRWVRPRSPTKLSSPDGWPTDARPRTPLIRKTIGNHGRSTSINLAAAGAAGFLILTGETQLRRQNDRARDATAIDAARLLRSALARHSSLCARISASSARRRAATCFKFSICAS
jgi:hypothetical protein